jgi:mannose-6-phosphate isomerase
MVDALAAACATTEGEWADECDLRVRLASKYPGDPGVLTAAMLNRVLLQPGQALYLGAGNLHAYVEGFGVEIMANSDNVLRGGLTPKHMDVPALLDVVDPTALHPQVLDVTSPVTKYPTPAPEFALTRVAESATVRHPVGPEIVLCLTGTCTLDDGAAQLRLAPGESAWLPASTTAATVSATGLSFVAALGDF